MAEPRPRPRVFTIASGAPFLATLAEALLSGSLVPLDADDPLALAGLTVLLPTRRAVRAFRETMIARLGGAAAILPVIRPIGDIDEEDHLLDAAVEPTADRLALPPTISRLNRRLALTRLTLTWARTVRRDMLALAPGEALAIPASAADATRLAGNLARLLDDMETAGVPWDALRRLVPEDHAKYFQITLDFLKIVAERWPAYLAEIGRVDPAVRRDTLIRAAAERLDRQPPPAPVVAAGSTGSIPATAALLKAIAGLPNGAVVLPGLDRGLDEAGWTAIDGGDKDTAAHGHPQYGLKQLIAAIGIARDEVEPLAADPAAARARFVSEAMRPAETVDAWVRHAVSAADALAGVDLIVARNEQEEATAIALAIREAVDKPETTVALVTPERTIARRVAVELARWGLGVDDSAGAPLAGEPAGVFARLLAEVAASDADPVKLLALLKHPRAAFGMDRALCRRAARLLEVALFRGHRLSGGVTTLKPALERARTARDAETYVPAARRRLTDDDWRLAGRLAERLAEALAPIEAAFAANKEIPVAAATDLLLAALAAAASDETGADGSLWQGADGEVLAALLTGLIDEHQGTELVIAPRDYPFFLTALLEDAVVQRPAGADPRIHIWGTLEARLQSVDLLILGGLDEGVWPAATRTDPWLSRTMRADIGLPPPERRLGLSAHDFAEAMAAPRVVVTRAEKRGGTPTVESRWLQRLRALAGEAAADAMTARGTVYVDLARDIDWVKAENVRPAKRPEPTPPLAARPRRLPVTDIEILIRDPYAIYAKRVLKLEELDPVGKAPDYALRGSLIHDALATFTKAWTGPYDASAEAALIAAGRKALAEIADFPDVHAIWSFRFANMARWLVGWEAARDAAIAERRSEVDGELKMPLGEGTFTLTGRADRIDVRTDGSLDILDYKTGTPPTAKQVAVGFAPQLGLEAAMAVRGAFDAALAGRHVETLAWLGLGRVGRDEPVKSAVERGWTTERVEQEVFAQFEALVTAFNDPARAYVSRARPMFETRHESPYDHLARVREWGLVESEEDLAWAGLPPRQ
jgi:ATP-dependent helicase/nuclease subunit B